MLQILFAVAILGQGTAEPLGPGDHKRVITVDKLARRHWVHVPPNYDAKQPAAVVLALHGAMMDGKMMEVFTDLSTAADRHNFVVVYPQGTGAGGIFLTWNAGQFPGDLVKNQPDDVKYLGEVLSDVQKALKVDEKRIYVTGLSNGAMMSYRLASEMSERIAAIAPVAGTLAINKYEPKRPVPVIHFHGNADALVPFNGPPKGFRFRSVNDTIMACVKANGCGEKPTEVEIAMKEDKLKVVRKDYGKGKNGAEVVLYVIDQGGHTWPGMFGAPAFLGL
ncbi:MAG: polyhydroxybutyrate depolymerase, partial [Planctomycetes bacterium]|nr:polyhydroxybutyrate depolymerase [Planctomycetota bacterium]